MKRAPHSLPSQILGPLDSSQHQVDFCATVTIFKAKYQQFREIFFTFITWKTLYRDNFYLPHITNVLICRFDHQTTPFKRFIDFTIIALLYIIFNSYSHQDTARFNQLSIITFLRGWEAYYLFMGNQARKEQLNTFPRVVVKVDINANLLTPYPRTINLYLSPSWKLAVFPNLLTWRMI